MKIIKRKQSKKYKNSKSCIAFEYPLENKKMDGAIIKLNGRYPEEGKVCNLKCQEIFYITNGSGTIEIEGIKNKVSKGDLIFIETKEKYF